MKTRQPDHSAYSVEYVEYDPITIAIALVSVLITVLHRNLWPTQSTSTTSTTQDFTGTWKDILEQAQPGIGSTNTESTKSGKAKSRPRLRSIKSTKDTAAQKKAAGGTPKVTQSPQTTIAPVHHHTGDKESAQPSVSITRSKPSEKPSNSPGDGDYMNNQAPQIPENLVQLKSTSQMVTPNISLKNVLVTSD